jgi:hypothetical protein
MDTLHIIVIYTRIMMSKRSGFFDERVKSSSAEA